MRYGLHIMEGLAADICMIILKSWWWWSMMGLNHAWS